MQITPTDDCIVAIRKAVNFDEKVMENNMHWQKQLNKSIHRGSCKTSVFNYQHTREVFWKPLGGQNSGLGNVPLTIKAQTPYTDSENTVCFRCGAGSKFIHLGFW
jgi:hypothetical protein